MKQNKKLYYLNQTIYLEGKTEYCKGPSRKLLPDHNPVRQNPAADCRTSGSGWTFRCHRSSSKQKIQSNYPRLRQVENELFEGKMALDFELTALKKIT